MSSRPNLRVIRTNQPDTTTLRGAGMAPPATPPAPGAFPRFQVLDVALTAATPADVVDTLLGWVARRERRAVCVFAVDSLLKCHDDPALAAIANAADLTLTDGMPLVWIGRKIARLPLERCYGPDIMLATIRAGCAPGVRHYFFGGQDAGVLMRLEARLRADSPDVRIVGRHAPPHRPLTEAEKTELAHDIEASGADIVWVGIGTPKQDYWMGEFRKRLRTPVLAAVGAAFNFHAGTVRQAPRWMMRHGLEWLFRLAAEPRRLWRRYVLGNPRFLALVLRQWLTRRPVPLGRVFPPPAPDTRR